MWISDIAAPVSTKTLVMLSLTGTSIDDDDLNDDVVDDGFFFFVEVLPSRYLSRSFFGSDNIWRYDQVENKHNIDVKQVVKRTFVMDNEELLMVVQNNELMFVV
jgi:hypothetical protein